MLYSDEHTVESPCGMAKEPSAQTLKEELYSHTSEGSTDELYETPTAQSVKSEESVDNLDYREHPEISAVVPEQGTEVGVTGVDAGQHSFDQFSHATYIDSALMCEQNAVIDGEGTDVEYESYGFGRHSADRLDSAEYAKIPWTHSEHYTEVDAEDIIEVEYDANDFNERSEQLRSIEEQEDSVDQQSHDYLKNAEFAAVCMKSRHSSPTKRSKMVGTRCRLTATYLV
jgi:hypothetical protein